LSDDARRVLGLDVPLRVHGLADEHRRYSVASRAGIQMPRMKIKSFLD
jgi:hypothetical protein